MNAISVEQEFIRVIESNQDAKISPDCTSGFMNSWKNEFNSWVSMRHLELKLSFINNKFSFIKITPINEIHRGGLGGNAVNGAVISSVLDGVIATVGFCYFSGYVCGTVHMSVSFLKPVFGEKIFAYGFATRRTKNIVFCEGRLYDEKLNLCATCNGLIASSNSKLEYGR